MSARTRIDFDLHGTVAIRAESDDSRDTAAIAKQLGPIRCTLEREPDIAVRFVDRIVAPAALHYLGAGDAAFTDEHFFILRGKSKARVCVKIPFDDIGGPCEILCEHGARSVPLLVPIINLTALAKGVLPLRASAFVFEGTGVLVAGWSRSGKSETLLAYMANGASYVGDEWIYVTGDGRSMHGIPETVQLQGWHLRQLERYRAEVPSARRALMAAARALGAVDRRIGAGRWAATTPARALRRAMPVVENRACVDVPAERLFAGEEWSGHAPLDKLLLTTSREGAQIDVRAMPADEIARRAVFAPQASRRALTNYYRAFRFAFPERRNALIEESEQIEHDLARRVLAKLDAHAVEHPYPFSMSELFDATVGVVRSKAAGVSQRAERPRLRAVGRKVAT